MHNIRYDIFNTMAVNEVINIIVKYIRKGALTMVAESETDIRGLKEIGRIVAIVRDEVIRNIRPGITTKELDHIAGELFDKYGAKSAPVKDYNFPGFTCISINDEIAHGIPGDRIVQQGDIVNIDASAELGGYYGDTGASIVVGKGTSVSLSLCECSQKALHKAIEAAKAGVSIRKIGEAIQNEARIYGFRVVRNLAGHGIGRKLHEEPSHILNYYDRFNNGILSDGMVIAVETFITERADYVVEARDGWTLKTPNQSLGAQFEHTIIITKGEPIILTLV